MVAQIHSTATSTVCDEYADTQSLLYRGKVLTKNYYSNTGVMRVTSGGRRKRTEELLPVRQTYRTSALRYLGSLRHYLCSVSLRKLKLVKARDRFSTNNRGPMRLLLNRYRPTPSSLHRHVFLAANAYRGVMRILGEIQADAKNVRPNMYVFALCAWYCSRPTRERSIMDCIYVAGRDVPFTRSDASCRMLVELRTKPSSYRGLAGHRVR
jgi:hypothetical protein